MSIILWIILGLVAGWLASVIMKNNAVQGPFMDIFLGIVGAVVGGALFNFFGMAGVTGFNFYSLAVATIGAVLLIGTGRAITGR